VPTIIIMPVQAGGIGLPASKFHRFPQLPTELRLAIWKIAIKMPRRIILRPFGDWSNPDQRATGVVKHNAYTVPSVLHACHEARTLALEHYTLYSSRRFHGSQSGGLYINYFVDTIQLQEVYAMLSLYAGVHEHQAQEWQLLDILELERKVKFLAVDENFMDGNFRGCWWIVSRFFRAEEVLIGEDDMYHLAALNVCRTPGRAEAPLDGHGAGR
jgi:hypothetical protein